MRAAVYILLAIVLFMAGLGASAKSLRAIKDDDIMSTSRRTTHLIQKDREPGLFWTAVVVNGLIAIALFGGSTALVVSSIRGRKK